MNLEDKISWTIVIACAVALVLLIHVKVMWGV